MPYVRHTALQEESVVVFLGFWIGEGRIRDAEEFGFAETFVLLYGEDAVGGFFSFFDGELKAREVGKSLTIFH